MAIARLGAFFCARLESPIGFDELFRAAVTYTHAMQTRILRVDPQTPDPEAIDEAARLLRCGQLVAFPTETVYGLGANALDASAVAAIYTAKGRPAHNPLIVHVADISGAREMAAHWSSQADMMARHFWPGPLTIVVVRAPGKLPDIVTAGSPTVALRVPDCSIALALIRAADIPVAAPSANKSNLTSPTRAEHVFKHLQGRIPLILDGGPATGGIESTVLDLSGVQPIILRPGLISREQIEAVVGPVIMPNHKLPASPPPDSSRPLPSPGLMPRHYAPRAPLTMLPHDCAVTQIVEFVKAHTNHRIGWLRMKDDAEPAHPPVSAQVIIVEMPNAPQAYAAEIYEALHALDQADIDQIFVDAPPGDDPHWHAVCDRLQRAAH